MTSYDAVLQIGAMVVSIVIATIKIVSVIRAEIASRMEPVLVRLEEVQRNIHELWQHVEALGKQIAELSAAHNHLQGEHDAFIRAHVRRGSAGESTRS